MAVAPLRGSAKAVSQFLEFRSIRWIWLLKRKRASFPVRSLATQAVWAKASDQPKTRRTAMARHSVGREEGARAVMSEKTEKGGRDVALSVPSYSSSGITLSTAISQFSGWMSGGRPPWSQY